MNWQSCFKDATPFAAMVLVELGEVGMTTLSKVGMRKGMSTLVYIVYYNALGVLILFPYFIFHIRRKKSPPLSFILLCKFALLGFLGKCMLIFGYTGVNYSSPTLSAAINNLTPLFTFLLAVIFRMEVLDIRDSGSRAKTLGTIIAVSGALIMTLYKGPAIWLSRSPSNLPHQLLLSEKSNWVLGGLFFFIASLFTATWNIFQAVTVKEYPDMVTIVFFSGLFGTIECTIFSLIVERNQSAWTWSFGIEMIAVLYSAIYGVLFRMNVTVWCLHKKGPLFVVMFTPLGIVIAAIMGVIFLGDIFYVGSVTGAIVITIGFYAVMWGQAKEKEKVVETVCRMESSTQNTPLLQNRNMQRCIDPCSITV